MAVFSVLLVTAAPPGQAAEAGGAFVKIDGREALLRSVELFLNRDNVKQVQVAVPSDALEEAKRKYGPHLSFSGVKLFGGGLEVDGADRGGGRADRADCTHVIVHDAARPAVPYSRPGGADGGGRRSTRRSPSLRPSAARWWRWTRGATRWPITCPSRS